MTIDIKPLREYGGSGEPMELIAEGEHAPEAFAAEWNKDDSDTLHCDPKYVRHVWARWVPYREDGEYLGQALQIASGPGRGVFRATFYCAEEAFVGQSATRPAPQDVLESRLHVVRRVRPRPCGAEGGRPVISPMVTHLSSVPFRALCAADDAGQHTTSAPEIATCVACLRLHIRAVEKRANEAEGGLRMARISCAFLTSRRRTAVASDVCEVCKLPRCYDGRCTKTGEHCYVGGRTGAEHLRASLAAAERERDKWKAGRDAAERQFQAKCDELMAEMGRITAAEARASAAEEREKALREAAEVAANECARNGLWATHDALRAALTAPAPESLVTCAKPAPSHGHPHRQLATCVEPQPAPEGTPAPAVDPDCGRPWTEHEQRIVGGIRCLVCAPPPSPAPAVASAVIGDGAGRCHCGKYASRLPVHEVRTTTGYPPPEWHTATACGPDAPPPSPAAAWAKDEADDEARRERRREREDEAAAVDLTSPAAEAQDDVCRCACHTADVPPNNETCGPCCAASEARACSAACEVVCMENTKPHLPKQSCVGSYCAGGEHHRPTAAQACACGCHKACEAGCCEADDPESSVGCCDCAANHRPAPQAKEAKP